MIALNIFRNYLLLATFWLYLIFNYGFMQIRGPFGIPLGEMVLVFALCTINYKVMIPRFLNKNYAIPFFLWWFFGFLHLLLNVQEFGVWAIRDASHVIESLFIIVGFTFAGNDLFLERFRRFLPWIFGSVALYSLTYPVRDLLLPFSPVLPGAQGQPVNLFFNYTNTAYILLAGSAYFLQEYFSTRVNRFFYFSILILTIVLLLFPSRTLFLELGIFIAFWMRRLSFQETRKFVTVLFLPILLLLGIYATGFPINGRFGTKFEVQDYIIIFTEIFHNSESQATLTSGNELRFLWWASTLQNWSQSWLSVLFGLGYGMPLINFVNTLGVQVREPHNDLISILARGGLISLIAFLWFQGALLIRVFKLTFEMDYQNRFASFSVGLFFILLCTMMNIVGESPFIMTFNTMPYYFISGILLRMFILRKY